jgi:hypothetical protein
MPNKPSLELSDIQIKVIEELDVLTDAFVSTFNELGKIIKIFSEEISIILEKFIKEKTDWRLKDTQCFDLSFRPLNEYTYEKKFSIEILKQYFCVAGQKTLVKEVKIDGKKKQVDELTLCWGVLYDIEDDPIKYFYVQIIKDKSTDGAIFSKNEYDKLANEIKTTLLIEEDNFYDVEHPDDGDSEYFLIRLDFKYLNKVSKFFEINKVELIEKFISKIKD